MKKLLPLVLCASLFTACQNPKPAETKTETAAAEQKQAPAEFADSKYSDMGKQLLASLSSGDIDSYSNSFAENAVFTWNNLDSVNGKAAINEFWKKRRAEVIDSLSFANQIWLPVKVNQPQSIEAPGVWALGWCRTTAKYKTGKSMTQLMHLDLHFDGSDKIDRAIMYLDQVPITAAAKK